MNPGMPDAAPRDLTAEVEKWKGVARKAAIEIDELGKSIDEIDRENEALRSALEALRAERAVDSDVATVVKFARNQAASLSMLRSEDCQRAAETIDELANQIERGDWKEHRPAAVEPPPERAP